MILLTFAQAQDLKFNNLGYSCPECAVSAFEEMGMDEPTARSLAYTYRSGAQATRIPPVSRPAPATGGGGGYGRGHGGGYGHGHGGGYGRGGRGYGYGGGFGVQPIFGAPLLT